ncbi:MAG: GH3 auxin-responsive promoter family protein [Chloroflexi bacterium]|nr:GH3 auxin-responsive promoter family protein [Chloroflexota bacterium]
MSSFVPAVGNSLWWLTCWPDAVRFRAALRDVATTQREVLRRIVARNAATDFGRRHGFAAIRSVEDFQGRVPLSAYEDYAPAIERIGAGERGVLTRDPVLLLEPTSGSSAPTKHIPYTAGLKADFQRAIAPWIVDLYRRDPRLLLGQAYWSITPVARPNARTPGGIPIGFDADADYLGKIQSRLVHSIQAVPPIVRLIDDVDAFYYVTLLFLVRSRRLTLISVWNPTFLTLLTRRLAACWCDLAADVARGTIGCADRLGPDVHRALAGPNRPDRRRAEEIREAFRSGDSPGASHARLWPALRLVSCWADAAAAGPAVELSRLFPQAQLQGKGLLATEGAVSIPLWGHGAVLAARSHFFELLPADETGQISEPAAPRLAHELEPGGSYGVVLTTSGGLYRYRLQDLVRVVGKHESAPVLRLVGRERHVSDHFGEKLNERHVLRLLEELSARLGCRPTFAMLAGDTEAAPAAYTLYVEAADQSDRALQALAPELEAGLQENYHYRYCRDLGQLGPARVFRIEGGAWERYLAAARAHGQRLGDVKPTALHRFGGWSRVFRGRLLSASL